MERRDRQPAINRLARLTFDDDSSSDPSQAEKDLSRMIARINHLVSRAGVALTRRYIDNFCTACGTVRDPFASFERYPRGFMVYVSWILDIVPI